MPEAGRHKLILQSAVIPYRWRDGQLEVLLITRCASGPKRINRGSRGCRAHPVRENLNRSSPKT
jgi:hypothetical protein